MKYQEMLTFIYNERKILDNAVEDIVRLNGKGELFRDETGAVEVRQSGELYELANPKGMFKEASKK